MAQKVQILLTDDLDGSEANETVTFSIDLTTYEIDLTDKNADKLRKALAPYIAVARKVSGGRKSSGRKSSGASDAKDIRMWAESQGIDVPSRGRIPQEIRDQYYASIKA